MSFIYLITPLLAFMTGRVALRLIHGLATAVGFVDKPDSRRKLHEVPIALGGGLAVWGASWLGWAVGMTGYLRGGGINPEELWFYSALVVASFSMLVLGILDDRSGLRGSHKLAGQLIAASILVGLGFRIDSLSSFGVVVDLGLFAIPITIFWIILVVNAFNLIDGMDGFCGSVALVASIALALMAHWSGRPVDALVGLAMAGALAAFLGDNLPPAKIYLGDAGSMTLGLMIAALSIHACSDGPRTAVSLPALISLLALPLLDVLTALGRRWLTGHSLFKPDRGHLHHRLQSRLGNTIIALTVTVGLAMIGACGATLARTSGIGDGVACIAIATSIAILVGTDTFGSSELRLLLFRLRPSLTNFVTSRSARRGVVRHECHLQGNRDWASAWDALVRESESAGLYHVELAIDMPADGETYHGLWTIRKDCGGGPEWSITHAFHVRGIQAGVIRVTGCAEASRTRYLEKVEGLIRGLESRLEEEMGWAHAGRTTWEQSHTIGHDSPDPPRLGPSPA